MTDIRSRHRKDAALGRRVTFAFASTLIGPLAALASMIGMRSGWWPYDIAWNVGTLLIALPLTVIGAGGALIAVVTGLMRPRLAGLAALASVVVSGAALAAFARVLLVQSHTAGPDVTTDSLDPPAFSAQQIADGASARAPEAPGNCPVQAWSFQSAPGAAGYALQVVGFDIQNLGVGRAVGTRKGVWFGSTWDATIRIRPGRTDIRVAARDPVQDRGEACRLAIRLADALKPAA
ncbi:hypothetical protein BH09PSE1_BH09PSE1_18480 [soil metagenome]